MCKKSTKAVFRIKNQGGDKMEIIKEDGKIKVACSYSTQFIKKAHEASGLNLTGYSTTK